VKSEVRRQSLEAGGKEAEIGSLVRLAALPRICGAGFRYPAPSYRTIPVEGCVRVLDLGYRTVIIER